MRLEIHHIHHLDPAVLRMLQGIEGGLHHKLEQIMRTLDETLDLVASQTTRIDSLIALTTDLHQKVIDAMGATITPSQAMRIDQVFSAVSGEAAKVDAAITANTIPAAPATETPAPATPPASTEPAPTPPVDQTPSV
jgi:hypothetical protein